MAAHSGASASAASSRRMDQDAVSRLQRPRRSVEGVKFGIKNRLASNCYFITYHLTRFYSKPFAQPSGRYSRRPDGQAPWTRFGRGRAGRAAAGAVSRLFPRRGGHQLDFAVVLGAEQPAQHTVLRQSDRPLRRRGVAVQGRRHLGMGGQ